MRVPKWQKKLTAGERRHLRCMNMNTREAVKKQMAFMSGELGEPCFECKSIGIKLGY